METTEESNLTDQLKESIKHLEAEERRHGSLRVLLEAALGQLQRKDETIKALKRSLAKAGRDEQ